MACGAHTAHRFLWGHRSCGQKTLIRSTLSELRSISTFLVACAASHENDAFFAADFANFGNRLDDAYSVIHEHYRCKTVSGRSAALKASTMSTAPISGTSR